MFTKFEENPAEALRYCVQKNGQMYGQPENLPPWDIGGP